jgi:hypothetical protein
MSELKVNKISPATGTAFTLGDSGDTFTVPSGATFTNSGTATGFGGGKLLSCDSTVVTANPTTTSASWADVSGFAVTTGTLASSSSKLLIFVQMVMGTTTTYHSNALLKITPAGGSAVYPYKGTGNADTGDQWNVSMHNSYAHSHQSNLSGGETLVYLYQASSTVAHTLQMMWRVQSGATMYLNRSLTGEFGRGVSSITYQEIGA